MKNFINLSLSFLLLSGISLAQMHITGTVLDQDGKPMPKTDVILTRYVFVPGATDAEVVEANKEGKYAITVDSSGVWGLWFTGVNHKSKVVALFVDKPENITLNVRLRPHDYVDSLTTVDINGQFNRFNLNTAVPMKREPGGTFMAEFETKADSFAYEIVGVTRDEEPINGTQSEGYLYDGRGNYSSVVAPVNGIVKILFDPKKLVSSDKPGKVMFADSESFDARFAGIYNEMLEEQAAWKSAYSRYESSGKGLGQFKYNWSNTPEILRQKIDHEKNGMLRQELYLNYIWLTQYGVDVDTSFIRTALNEAPAESWIWSLDPILYITALDRAGIKGAEYGKYMEEFVEKNPCPWEMKALNLEEEFSIAKTTGDTAKQTACYNILQAKYGDTPYAKLVKSQSGKESAVAVGKPAPRFSIPSLQDSTKIFTNDSFKGKYLMIDFWATWCAPCVGETKYLQKAYESFKDKNFTILSVSLDATPGDVARFREYKWPMPWLHAFARSGWNAKMVTDFDVFAIPRPILIDPQGTIVAMDDQLRGDNLEKTLEKFPGK